MLLYILSEEKDNNWQTCPIFACGMHKKKKMDAPYIENKVEYGSTGSVSYTLNICVEKWIYEQNVKYREVFTHGTGTFNHFDDGDVLSLALGGEKNDIYVRVNTHQALVHNNQLCFSDSATKRASAKHKSFEHIIVENHPLAQKFHVSIVLTKHRIDVYVNGKLNKTKVLGGYSFSNPQSTIELPFTFFQGEKLEGYVSNFNFFDFELPLSRIQEIYTYGMSTREKEDDMTESILSCDEIKQETKPIYPKEDPDIDENMYVKEESKTQNIKLLDSATLEMKGFDILASEKFQNMFVTRLNKSVDIPMLNETKEGKMFKSLYNIFLETMRNTVEKLVEDSDSDTLRLANQLSIQGILSSEDFKNSFLIELNKSIDIPILNERSEHTVFKSLYKILVRTVEDALDEVV